MDMLKRINLSIGRNLGKTILLLLIVFILGCVMSGAISVRQAILSVDHSLRAALPPVATVGSDFIEIDRIYVETGEWPDTDGYRLTLDMMHEIAALPYVKDYEFFTHSVMASKDIERYVSSDAVVSSHNWLGAWEGITLRSVSRPHFLDLSEERIEIIQGRTFTEAEINNLVYVAVISEDFARINDLRIGSTLVLEDLVWDIESYDFSENFYTEENVLASRSHDFEIIGIFKSNIEINVFDRQIDAGLADELINSIYVPSAVVEASSIFASEQIRKHDLGNFWFPDDPALWQNVYVLHDSNDIPAFREAVETIAPPLMTALDAGGGLGEISSSMESLTDLAAAILWMTIAAAVVILSLLITLLLRERRYEIGIYLALGEKKARIVAQMMVEVMAIALVAITLSLLVGNMLASTISEQMLRNNLIAEQSSEQWTSGLRTFGIMESQGFSAPTPSTDEIIASYAVSLDATTVAMFFFVTTGTILVASIVPMLYITRLNPTKILL